MKPYPRCSCTLSKKFTCLSKKSTCLTFSSEERILCRSHNTIQHTHRRWHAHTKTCTCIHVHMHTQIHIYTHSHIFFLIYSFSIIWLQACWWTVFNGFSRINRHHILLQSLIIILSDSVIEVWSRRCKHTNTSCQCSGCDKYSSKDTERQKIHIYSPHNYI